MAVSFLSRPVAATPYIAPIDQNLVFNAMLKKQQQFDQGVQVVDQQLKALSSQTILNTGHKAYYDQKVATLTEQINALGGADFSERNTMQQIGGLSRQVSGDSRIIGAIADTRRIQKEQQQMETWKADPKKYGNAWAVQNQYYLDQQQQAYVNDTSERAQFNGKAETYFDHGKMLHDRFDKIRSQIQKSGGYEDFNGNYIERRKDLTALEIGAIVDMEVKSDPRFKHQLQIDSNYEYRGVDPATFKAFRTEQVTAAKSMLAKNIETFKQANLLDLKTGNKEQQDAKKKQYDMYLLQADTISKGYDQQLARIATMPHAEAVEQSHLDTYRTRYENEYAFKERKLTLNPIYGINLAHTDRVTAMGLKQQEINQRGQLFSFAAQNEYSLQKDQQEFLRSMQDDKQESDIANGLGLKKTKSGDYYATDPNNVIGVTTNPDLTKPGLGTLYEAQASMASRQNQLVEDLVIEHISNGDVDTATRLRKQLDFRKDANGNVVDFRYAKKDVSPNMAIAAVQYIKNYNKMLNGEQPDPGFAEQVTTDSRKKWNMVRSGVVDLRLNQKKLDTIQAMAVKESGLTPAELRERETLTVGKATEWRGFRTQGSRTGLGAGAGADESTDYLDIRLNELNDRYNAAAEKVAAAMGGVQGQENGALLLTNDAAKSDSTQSRTIRNRIINMAVLPEGRDNQELTTLSEALRSGEVVQQRLILDKQQVEVTVQPLNKEGKPDGPLITGKVSFAGTREWKTLVPEMYQNTVNGHYINLQKELDETGGIYTGDQAHVFSTTKGMPLGVTAIKDSNGQYNLGYMYKGKQLKMPMYGKGGKPFLPDTYRDKPIEWVENELDTWVNKFVFPMMQLKYGMMPDGKINPDYVPTVDQFDALLHDKRYF